MKYQVLQDNKPADTTGYPTIGDCKFWEKSIFDTYEEARLYAILWAYPINKAMAMKSQIDIPVNTPTDLSMSEHPVMMEIKEVSE